MWAFTSANKNHLCSTALWVGTGVTHHLQPGAVLMAGREISGRFLSYKTWGKKHSGGAGRVLGWDGWAQRLHPLSHERGSQPTVNNGPGLSLPGARAWGWPLPLSITKPLPCFSSLPCTCQSSELAALYSHSAGVLWFAPKSLYSCTTSQHAAGSECFVLGGLGWFLFLPP